MTLSNLAIGLVFTLYAVLFLKDKGRTFYIFIFSLIALFALQPTLPIRHIDFWLPTIVLFLIIVMWIAITPKEYVRKRENFHSVGWICLVIIILGLTRYIEGVSLFTASTPPQIQKIILALVLFCILGLIAVSLSNKKPIVLSGIFIVIGLLIVLKYPVVSVWLAKVLRMLNNQAVDTATVFDIRWLGFSYITFRLIHTLLDYIKRRIEVVTLQEYVSFVIFYPALMAGPIDRLQRFIKDLRAPLMRENIQWAFIIERLALGLFKKFILADSFALIALSPQNASQIQTSGWAWVLLYAYAFQIYFDFSGYTDFALGLARILGIKLPENFNRSYSKPNLTNFWNNWHMSLTQWFRAYVFNPFSRSLHRTSLATWSMILLSQVLTMTLIGLWHGVTQNFVIWGVWHGLGLFIHNRWQKTFRVRVSDWSKTPFRQRIANWSGIILTFNFVALGWVWFVLPSPQLTFNFFKLLFQLN